MFRTLKKEKINLLKIRSMGHDDRLPQGLLTADKNQITELALKFEDVKKLDRINEQVPGCDFIEESDVEWGQFNNNLNYI